MTALTTLPAGRGEQTIAAPPPALTLEQIRQMLMEQSFYLLPGQFTYSIPTTGSQWAGYNPGTQPFVSTYSVLDADQAEAFETAIFLWDRLIAPDFVKTDDVAQPGLLRAAFTDVGDGGAYVFTPSVATQNPGALTGDIWITKALVGSGFYAYDYAFMLLLHEIGHVLGFKHPFDEPVLPAAYDTLRYTVMSYEDFADMYVTWVTKKSDGTFEGAHFPIFPVQPTVLDIAAVQARYGAEPDTRPGDDVFVYDAVDQGYGLMDTIYDAGGIDTLDLSALTRSSTVDLTPGAYSSIAQYSLERQIADAKALGASDALIQELFGHGDVYTWTDNLGIAFSTFVENVVGGATGETITGNAAANLFTGNGGDDTLDGGAGTDTARYTNGSSSYSWSPGANGTWTVRDLRAGSPDGTDTLTRMERLEFTDRTVDLMAVAIPPALAAAFSNILRLASPAGAALTVEQDLATKMAAGTLTLAQAIGQTVIQADASTSVATLAYQFFTGRIPSLGGIDFLVSPTGPNTNNLNSAYYQSFNLENRYINFAVNLGKFGDGKDAFQAAYGARTLFDATKSAYATIFGGTPTDAKVTALLSGGRDAYFAVYGGDGVTGIGTKAAMVGWLMAEAVKADVGMYSRANDAFLTDLADGATFAVDLVGVYGRPEFSVAG